MSLMDTTRFAGKAVIVTGGGSGIGAAAVRRFWREGAQVVAADLVEDRAAALIAELGAERAFAIKVDVSDYASVEAMVAATLERFGRLDILVANAGVAFKAEVGTTTLEQWRSTLAVDLDGVFYCVRAALPHLLAARGSIVTTASVSGLGGDRRMSAYNAA